MIPSPWVALVLALAAFRLTRLAGWDDLPPIVRARYWAVGARQVTRGSGNAQMGVGGKPETEWTFRRPMLWHFLTCPYCVGFWVTVAVYGLWAAAGAPGHLTPSSWFYYLLVPVALSAAVGIIARRLDP